MHTLKPLTRQGSITVLTFSLKLIIRFSIFQNWRPFTTLHPMYLFLVFTASIIQVSARFPRFIQKPLSRTNLISFQFPHAYGEYADYGDVSARSGRRPRPPDANTFITSSGSTDFSSSGPWEDWRPETQCSRQCGGGVASDGRYCRDPNPG